MHPIKHPDDLLSRLSVFEGALLWAYRRVIFKDNHSHPPVALAIVRLAFYARLLARAGNNGEQQW
jgi:hypothetical protein